MSRLAQLMGVILASGEAVALVVMVFTVAFKPGPGDAELIAAITTLTAATLGALSGWLMRDRASEGPAPREGEAGPGRDV
jgi:hypothetical protein